MSETKDPDSFEAQKAASPTTRLASSPLRRDMLDLLARDGLISAGVRQDGLAKLHPAHSWGQWSLLLLAVSGTVLILSGVVFFFAFNWVTLSSFEKFSLLQGTVVVTAAGAAFCVRKPLLSHLLLLSASVLVGVFLAVFGQIYQTGADAWQLFALWVLLILPWTLLSRFALQWVLWFGLLNLALALWWDHVPWHWATDKTDLMAVLAIVNGGALILRETLRQREDFGWLDGLWTRWLLVGAVLVLMFLPLRQLLTLKGIPWDSHTIGIGLLAVLSYALIFVIYRFVWLDLPVLAIWALCMCLVVISSVFFHFVTEEIVSEISGVLLTGCLAIALFSLAASWLRKTSAKSGGQDE